MKQLKLSPLMSCGGGDILRLIDHFSVTITELETLIIKTNFYSITYFYCVLFSYSKSKMHITLNLSDNIDFEDKINCSFIIIWSKYNIRPLIL